MKINNIIRCVLVAELLLLVPLVAMFLSDEVDWGLTDFIIVGVLLGGIGVAFQLIVSGLKNSPRLVVIGIGLAAAMILIWIELAVGLFGSPFAGS